MVLWPSISVGKLCFVVTAVVLVIVVAVSGIMYRMRILTLTDLTVELVVLVLILSYGAVATILLTLQMAQMKRNIASLMKELDLVSSHIQSIRIGATDTGQLLRVDEQGRASEKAL